jgi:hypothetical protein
MTSSVCAQPGELLTADQIACQLAPMDFRTLKMVGTSHSKGSGGAPLSTKIPAKAR